MSFTSKNDTYLEHSEGFLITAAWKTGVLMALLLTVLPTPAAAAPSAPILSVSGWAVLLGVGIGAGAVGLLHWIRLRHVREQAAGRVEALRAEKEEAEEALDAATDRAEKRKEISEAKSAFLEEVSHAFRRPLTLTLGPIDALLEGRHGSLSEEVRTQLRLAQQNGTRVLWLAGQLMDLAELETGSMTLSATEDNLPAFVSRSLRSFEDLAERRGVSLGFESSLDDPTVSYDEEKMETMLANLLSSAFRAAGEGGRVRVSLHPAPVESGEGSDVELRLEHGGSDLEAGLDGMPFDWARDEDVRQKPGNVSANVGLYLADQLADLHGGELWTGGELQTAGELQTGGGADKTSAFIVRLPRQPSTCEEARPDSIPQTRGDTIPRFRDETDERGALELSRRALASTPVRKDGSSPPGPTVSPNLTERGPTRKGSTKEGPIPGEEVLPGPGAPARHAPSRSDSLSGADGPADEDARADADRTTVLVIDDNSVICTLVRSHLEPEYRVEEAHDGAEGYALARSILPDLVITDVMMPEVDGFELCRKIKEDPDIDHVPVVFLTARADLEGKVEGYDTGADAYLTKPFEPEELIARTRSLIETRQRLRESFRDGPDPAAAGDAGLSAAGVENAEAALPPTAEAGSLEETIEEAIEEHLTDPEFGVSDLAEATALSASQLRRRMKEIYERTPVQLIRRRRLEAGARLLREREEATIGEVAYAVGFNSQSYFSRSFREEFGTPPSQYRTKGMAA